MNNSETQNMQGMPVVWHVRLGIRVLSRILHLFVVWPACFAAAVVLTFGLLGESPSRFLTETAFDWAEASFRSAPAGSINVQGYEDQKMEDGQALPPVAKKETHVSTYSVEQGKAEFSAALTTWYWRLVSLVGVIMFLLMGWREFLVVPAAIAAEQV